MNLNYLILVVLAVNAFLSIGIYLRNRADKTNRLFVAFVAFLSLWITSNFLENEPDIVGAANLELFLRLDFVLAIFFMYYWFRFCEVFTAPGKSPRIRYWLGRISLLVGIALVPLSLLTPLIITEVAFFDGVIHFQGGMLWPIYAVMMLFWSFGGLALLYFGRRRAKKQEQTLKKQQINLVFIGFLISLGNAIVINLFLQTFFPITLEISRLGLYGMVALVAFTAYAIRQQHLFDLKLLIARAVSYVILVVFIVVLYTLLLFLPTIYISGFDIEPRIAVTGIILTTIVALTFPYLRGKIGKVTDRIFFKGQYNSDKLLSELTRIMAEEIDLEKMAIKMVKLLTKKMRITTAAFLIIDQHKVIKTYGTDNAEYKHEQVGLEKLFHAVTGKNKNFFFSELPEGETKEMFRDLNISLAAPIFVEKTKEVAILILGPKLSGETYNQRDGNLLEILAPEAGIAIENAKAVAQIKEFSRILEKRVEERTKELKETQESELDKAREVAKLKDEFVFIAAHELRTPVTAIKGFLELVSESTKNFPKDIQEHLNAISSASNHLGQLINDLLQIARSEAGTFKIEVQPIKIDPIIAEVMEEVSPLTEEAKIKLEMGIRGTIPNVLADPGRLKEVVTNLLSNAIKYNRENGEVDITVFAQDNKVITEVRDTGYGIPQDQRSRIFQKFFRADIKEAQEVLGTGLGLFISRMIVQKMGGEIKFTSVEGQGSTFSFSLPVAANL